MNKVFFAQNISQLTKAVNGYLYNWYAVSDSNFAPTDWKVPDNTDYATLSTFLGGDSVSGGKLKETGTVYWNSPNTGADNSSGFTAYGSGARNFNGSFSNLKNNALLWTKTEHDAFSGKYSFLAYNSAIHTPTQHNKKNGSSVRLVYTGAGSPTTVNDYDGNEYDVVQIGTQYWTVQNWKCTKLNNGTALTKVTDNTTWSNAGAGNLYYCAYNNNETDV